MAHRIYPDSILENWGEDIRNDVINCGVYCILDPTIVKQLVHKLLEWDIYGALLTTDYVIGIDPHNGLERRAKAAGHIKIILDSLGEDNTKFDSDFIRMGHDMIEVWKYYLERKETGSFYKKGLVVDI